jgi:hypothetical protein
MDSHSSSLSGFWDSFKVLAACSSHDRIPILTAHSRFHLGIINVTVTVEISIICFLPLFERQKVFLGRRYFSYVKATACRTKESLSCPGF